MRKVTRRVMLVLTGMMLLGVSSTDAEAGPPTLPEVKKRANENKQGSFEWQSLYINTRDLSDWRYYEVLTAWGESVGLTPAAEDRLEYYQGWAVKHRNEAEALDAEAKSELKIAVRFFNEAVGAEAAGQTQDAIKWYTEAADYYAQSSYHWARGIDKIDLRNCYVYAGVWVGQPDDPLAPNVQDPTKCMKGVLEDPASYLP